jgi:DNA-binding XRE family transcriptional regulator
MSSSIGLSARLHEVRSRLGYPQSKIAAALGIADRSYKNYETGKRELPLSTAVAICNKFNVDLNWLVFGEVSLSRADASKLFEVCVSTVLNEAGARNISLSTPKIAKMCAYLASQCLAKGTEPKDEIGAVMELIE